MLYPPPETEIVTAWKVACDGGATGGHPRVWLSISHERGYVECGYCDKRYVHESFAADPEANFDVRG